VEFGLSSISEMSDLRRSEGADFTPSAGIRWRGLEGYKCWAPRRSGFISFGEILMIAMGADETRLNIGGVQVGC